MRARNVHITRIRRFAGAALNVTEIIRASADRDFPDNEVQELIAHRVNRQTGKLQLRVQWLGFTKDEQTWEDAESLHEYVPGFVRQYVHDNRNNLACKNFFKNNYT